MPENAWPSKGDIRFEDVSMRYDTGLSPVLHSVCLHINAGEKVLSFKMVASVFRIC